MSTSAKQNNTNRQSLPDSQGHFGEFGGRFVPDTLYQALEDLTDFYLSHKSDADFCDEFRHLPVIMLTAQKHTNVKIEALRIGVDDYLTKPFETIELLARVENLIQNTQVRLAQNPPTNKKNIAIPIITAADMKWLKTIETKVLGNIDNAQFKLSDLAAEMNITMRTLQQKVKKITGKTPKAYQRDIVLHQAKKLLKSGEIKTVSELTYQLGFEDPHYFSKLYKKQFGLSPKEELNLLK